VVAFGTFLFYISGAGEPVRYGLGLIYFTNREYAGRFVEVNESRVRKL
jgi:hypothetical protein